MKQRIIWIDWAKTILIYLMVVGHCNPNPLHAEIFYAFHMPAFFIISGLLFHVHTLGKTIKSIVVPVCFISILNALIFTIPKILKGSLDVSVLFHNWWLQYFTVDSGANLCLFGGVWFVIVLLICRICMLFLVKLPNRFLWGGIGICILFMEIEPYVNIIQVIKDSYLWRVIPSVPFFILGYMLKDKIEKLMQKWNIKTALLLTFLFLILCLYNGRCDMYGNNYGRSYVLFFFNAVLGSGVVFGFCNCLKRNKSIEFFSKGTLIILGMNMFFRNISKIFIDYSHLDSLVLHSIIPWIQGLFVILLCYFPIKILLKKAPYLLGK